MSITRAVTPAGLIRGTKSYMLTKYNGELLGVYVGNPGRDIREMRLRGPIQKMVAQKVLDNLEQKLVEAEKKLEGKSMGELSGAKANLHIQIGEITDMQLQLHKKFEYPELRIQTEKKKYVFHCRKSSMEEVEQFVKELRK